LTRVIESVLNYNCHRRPCLTVELSVKGESERESERERERDTARERVPCSPVKFRQSLETRSVGLMDFSTPFCLREREGGREGEREREKESEKT
jgi:hypothetical protein